MSNAGWIKLWRKIEDNPVLNDAIRYALFVRLLNRAAHRPCRIWFKERWFDLQRGEVLMSERDMARLLNCDRQRIRTAIRVLKNAEMLTHQLTHGLTHVTICNYERYQIEADEANPAINPPANPGLTQGQPTEQEGEESKEGKNKILSASHSVTRSRSRCSYPDAFDDFWRAFPKRGTDTKAKAHAAWAKAVKNGAAEAELLNGAMRFATYADQTGCETPHVQTWINRDGWTASYELRANGNGRHEPAKRESWYGRRIMERIAAEERAAYGPDPHGDADYSPIGRG